MKKVLFLLLIALAACSSSKFGKGGDNATQYVREQIVNSEGIESVEATEEKDIYVLNWLKCELMLDSIVSDGEDRDKAYNKAVDFADSINEAILGMKQTNAPGYMQKMYVVTVIYKSTKKEPHLVIMARDGVTPFMTYDEYDEHLQPLREKLAEYTIKIVTEDDI